jgi:chorismate mutase
MHKKIVFSMGILLSLFFGKAKAQDAVRQDTLGYYRKQIDTLDQQIIDLLGERMKAARAIGIYKLDHQIGVVQSARFEEVLQHAIQRGKERQLSEAFIRALYSDVHQESIHQQEVLQAERKKQ